MRVHNVQHAIPTGTSRAIVNSHSRRECIHLVVQEVVDRNISCNEEYPLGHFRSRVFFGDSNRLEYCSFSYELFTSTLILMILTKTKKFSSTTALSSNEVRSCFVYTLGKLVYTLVTTNVFVLRLINLTDNNTTVRMCTNGTQGLDDLPM